MSDSMSIVCPSCQKKFKGRPELRGKKVRCPGCSHAFVVNGAPASSADGAKKAPAAAAAKGKPAGQPRPVAVKAAKPPTDDEDEYSGQANPYGVTELDLAPRCPHCANELESEDAIICLYCGYNTETRQIGHTTTVIATTGGEHFKWLLPGLTSGLGVIFLGIFCLFFSVMLPTILSPKSWLTFLDHESMRMWMALICLGGMWGMGIFAYKRLIMEPKPMEKKKD